MDKKLKAGQSHGYVMRMLRDPSLWRVSRDSLARGVAVGLFTGMIPVLPFQTLLAIVCAFLIRANLPIAFSVSWISNPVTLVPLAYFTYRVGHLIVGGPALHFSQVAHGKSWGVYHAHHFLPSGADWALFAKSFFVGLPIVAFGVALFGYLLVKGFWWVKDVVTGGKRRR